MRKSDDPAEPPADYASQAEFFSKFFIEKINQIREDTAGGSERDFQPTLTPAYARSS